MSAEEQWALVAVGLVCLVSVVISWKGLRWSRSTGDVYVASRSVSPMMNASAVAGEYLSAASFLGVAGLILAYGSQGLWFPVGYTAGFLTLLLFVAAPLRRSGAYTVPDFLALRFRSAQLRRLSVMVAVMTGWLYIIPQLHGASLALSTTTALPGWVGPAVVVLVVLPVVLSGGMRSVTLVQAVQYWIKLSALLVPTVFVLLRLGAADAAELPGLGGVWEAGLTGDGGADAYRTASLVLALIIGALGLPHVLVRFYTNPDGGSARRTTMLLLALLSGFYLLPVILGAVARAVFPPEGPGGAPDAALLQLPAELFEGASADLLAALIAGGAFAAFLSTASGLVVSVAGVLSQEFFGGTVQGFRIGALLAVGLPLAMGTATSDLALAGAVAMVFTFSASALAPVLLLGIWWRRLTVRAAAAGMVTGGVLSLGSLMLGVAAGEQAAAAVLLYPALWCIPLSFAVTVLTAVLGRDDPPSHADAVLDRLHTPEPSAGRVNLR